MVELRLRTAAWREGVRLLADDRSDLHCGGVNTGEPLPAHLRRERFLDVTAGIVAANGYPLHGGTVRPGDLFGWPSINFDGAGAADDGAERTSLAAVLDELRNRTGRPVGAVVRAGSAGLTWLAAGPSLAGPQLDLLDQPPGTPLKAPPLTFGRPRYRAGFLAHRSAEDLEPFRMLEATVRHAALGRDG